MENTSKARLLRKNQTDAEAALWQKLRGRGLGGCKFRRQVPVGPYVADFLCKEAMLIVELDGGQHTEQVEYDRYRTDFLAAHGYKVIRFWNNEVLINLEGILETLHKHPHPNPLPEGEGTRRQDDGSGRQQERRYQNRIR